MQRYEFPNNRFEQIKDFILDSFSKPQLKEEDFEQLLLYMQKDKKNRANKIAIVLLEDIGVYHYEESLSQEEILACLQNFIHY
jgi:3-dehydroquinate synthetase